MLLNISDVKYPICLAPSLACLSLPAKSPGAAQLNPYYAVWLSAVCGSALFGGTTKILTDSRTLLSLGTTNTTTTTTHTKHNKLTQNYFFLHFFSVYTK